MASFKGDTSNQVQQIDTAVFLQNYANKRLTEKNNQVRHYLARRKVATEEIQPLQEVQRICLRFGENVSLKNIQKHLVLQIDAAADFLCDFYIGILGQYTSIFYLHEVEIYVARNISYGFSFTSGTLSIQIPSWQISWRKPYGSYPKLKNAWNQGKQFPRFSPTRKVWWLLNPIGEFRSNLRSGLMLAIQRRILGIDELLVKFGLSETEQQEIPVVREDSPSLGSGIIAFLKDLADEKKLGVNLTKILQGQTEDSLLKLVKVFEKNLANPQQLEEIIDAGVLSLQEVINKEDSQVDVKMWGFVNVGNYHRIDVDLNISSGYGQKYIEVVPRKANVKAVQFGFVNVYTIDDVTVKPNLHRLVNIDFETAALERSLRELDLLPGNNNSS